MDNYVTAIEIYKNLLEKQPNERLKQNLMSASIAYGYKLLDKQDYGQAILYFEDAIDLNDNTDLIDDFDFDSINIISLVICLEKEFDIEIPDEFLLLENMRSYVKIKKMLIDQISADEVDDGRENI